MNELESEVFAKLRQRLNLAHVDPASVSSATPLFDGGLEFDSIDVLEVSAMVQKDYGITVAVAERSSEVFGTLGTLAAFVEKNRSRDAKR
ncbi:MAG: acyl carrier protein [Deltaproteobacteria bacterium]|nr:acyl carrier protein [Deltaproteobacteria bacterium]